MKSLTLALVLAALPLAASADYVERYRTSDGRLVERHYIERRYAEPAPRVISLVPLRGNNNIHTGGLTLADHALADRIGIALAEDPALNGLTATVVASNGDVSLSGSAPRHDQAQRAETIARELAGYAVVSGSIDSQGGS